MYRLPHRTLASPPSGLPRLVAFDIDGTLLTPQGCLRERTATALASLSEAGVITALATGRPWPQTETVARQVPTLSYAVCLNGATVMDATANERIADRSMTHVEAVEAAEIVRKHLPKASLGLDMADGRHLWEPQFAPGMPADLLAELSVVRVADAIAEVDGAVLTWLVHSSDLDTLAMVELLAPRMPLGTEIRPSGLDMAEIAAAGVNKSAGLEIVCERYGISASQVTVFGDGLNDIEMLSWAGYGVAMANASAAVRSVADHIAPANEDDGVAAVVEAMLAGSQWPSSAEAAEVAVPTNGAHLG
ncbi:HAD family hydrolase [Candidatus Poriferisodalis sp.]|uniref:HAD family hydrolase n=1 Tax=Candidatus Poriferisodalis sp. TaxID=3101277 RepID=UPI003B013C8E